MIPASLDYGPLFSWLEESELSQWGQDLPELVAQQLRPERWGDMPEWEETLRRLPEIDPLFTDFSNGVQIGDISLMDKGRRLALQATLMGLHPWRKGTVQFIWYATWTPSGAQIGNGIACCPIWPRLKGRTILDVGCGNGYHCWRMLGADAERVIGIDPSAKFVFQFYAIKRFAGNHCPSMCCHWALNICRKKWPPSIRYFPWAFSITVAPLWITCANCGSY